MCFRPQLPNLAKANTLLGISICVWTHTNFVIDHNHGSYPFAASFSCIKNVDTYYINFMCQ